MVEPGKHLRKNVIERNGLTERKVFGDIGIDADVQVVPETGLMGMNMTMKTEQVFSVGSKHDRVMREVDNLLMVFLFEHQRHDFDIWECFKLFEQRSFVVVAGHELDVAFQAGDHF